MTHTDLLRAMETLSSGRISGRFFEFYPQRRVDIRYWLAGWIKRGVVPLATLNYQVRHLIESRVDETLRSLEFGDWTKLRNASPNLMMKYLIRSL